ncbi:MAG: hypothetical protein J6M19_06125 [Bacteroidaceae bacterium]|nr:hypothetical protein [Bacteroidaceae bacterium]
MIKYIQKLQNLLRIEMGVAWLLMVVAIVLGELDVIPNGLVLPHSADEFKLNTAAIVLTVVGIPVALKLFTLNTTKGLRRMNNEEALKSYHVWSAVRLGILCLGAVFSIAVYYLATSVSGAFCALIAAFATLYCWPSGAKISAYLEGVNKE